MQVHDFLVEIGTEELPPKALKTLSDAFTRGIEDGLQQAGLSYSKAVSFASPRRLTVRIEDLAAHQPDKQIEKRGPSKKAAFDDQGQPSRALLGFTQSMGIEPAQLEEMDTPKGAWLVYRTTEAGQDTRSLLNEIVLQSLHKLPIPKRMRWGARRVEFVRPLQWVVMLFANEVVPGEILGIANGKLTRGHRVHSKGTIEITQAREYEQLLLEQGRVIADYAQRKAKIRAAVQTSAEAHQGIAVIDEDLLDEVTSLNEWPVPLVGQFDARFLSVPTEALISSMKEHQKYFHMLDAQGRMMPNFITLANIESQDPQQVIEGNERVIRPRLSDAAFFFETDKQQTLETRRESLKKIVFQTKLGSVFDKTQRVSKLAAKISAAIGGNPVDAERAGQLAKSDLVTEMVLEFTDLQGVMGYHYALHDGENEEVALALNEQYQPKFAGDALPSTLTGCALSIAEKLDSLVGLFGINQPPTGTKDPFALRRAALGVLRVLVEKHLALDLTDLIADSIQEYHNNGQQDALENQALAAQLIQYMLERFRARYEDEAVPVDVFLAVNARRPTQPLDFDKRIKAVYAFSKRPEAEALAAANKRVANILAKQEADLSNLSLNDGLLTESAERDLSAQIASLSQQVMPLFDAGDYQAALSLLAGLQGPVDRFFEEVMVMAEDPAIKQNRLVLLKRLSDLFLRVADISLLSK